MLSAMAQHVPSEKAVDSWTEDALTVTRVHGRPRHSRFTPLRVAEAPPVRSLTGTRVTSGHYVDNGEAFTVVDNWRTRSTAHAYTSRSWIGTTRFWRRRE